MQEEAKTKVLREVLNCDRELVSYASRKVVPDNGSLNRERSVTKALRFLSCTKTIFFNHQKWNGESESECKQEMDGRYGGRVPSKKRKAKVVILKIMLSLTGSQ